MAESQKTVKFFETRVFELSRIKFTRLNNLNILACRLSQLTLDNG